MLWICSATHLHSYRFIKRIQQALIYVYDWPSTCSAENPVIHLHPVIHELIQGGLETPRLRPASPCKTAAKLCSSNMNRTFFLYMALEV